MKKNHSYVLSVSLLFDTWSWYLWDKDNAVFVKHSEVSVFLSVSPSKTDFVLDPLNTILINTNAAK